MSKKQSRFSRLKGKTNITETTPPSPPPPEKTPTPEPEKTKKQARVCKTKECGKELADEWPLEYCPDCTIRIAEQEKKARAPPPRLCRKCNAVLADKWELDVCPDCAKKALGSAYANPSDIPKTKLEFKPIDVGLKPKTRALQYGIIFVFLVIIIGMGLTLVLQGGVTPYVPPVENPTEYDWNGMTVTGWYTIEAWVTQTTDGVSVETAMTLYHEYSWGEFEAVEAHGYDMMGVTHQFNDAPLSASVAVRFSVEWGTWSPYSNTVTVETQGEQKNIEWEWQEFTVHVAINR